ncbi:MAG: glycoside hydrolase family 97 C-terminal domain-containing protein, partial [Putridiphycobacter sp.]
LQPNTNFIATIYEDGPNADYLHNPTEVKIRKIEVNNRSSIALHLATGGGAAISIIKK